MTTTQKAGMGVLVVTGLIGLLYLTRKPPEGRHLYAGDNYIRYDGPAVTATEAFASIADYLVSVYAWHELEEAWSIEISDGSIMEHKNYKITVTEDCLWVY